MNTINRSLVLCLAMGPALTLADVSYVQRIEVIGGGAMSALSSETMVLTQIAGRNSRVDSEVQTKSTMAAMLGGGGRSGSIVRIDDGLVITLKPENAQYSEITLEQAGQQITQAREAMSQTQGEQSLPVDEESCLWSSGDVTVERQPDKTKIAGVSTTHQRLVLKKTCAVRETGNSCDLTWVMDTWLASKMPAEKEVRDFQQAYAKALGQEDLMQMAQGPGQGMLAMFSDNWDVVFAESEKLKGFPLRTSMSMQIGGEKCTTESGEPIALDGIWSDAADAAYSAAVSQVGSAAGSAVGESVSGAFGDSIGGSIGGSAVGAAAGSVVGGLTGMFQKKKEKPAPKQKANPAAQQVTVFRIETEVTEWKKMSVPAERFQVPGTWTKI